MSVIGRRLLADAKAHAQSDTSKSVSVATDDTGLGGRDLFSLLVKANTASEAGEERLSDADVLSRTSPIPLSLRFLSFLGATLIPKLQPLLIKSCRGPNVPSRWARDHLHRDHLGALRAHPEPRRTDQAARGGARNGDGHAGYGRAEFAQVFGRGGKGDDEAACSCAEHYEGGDQG